MSLQDGRKYAQECRVRESRMAAPLLRLSRELPRAARGSSELGQVQRREVAFGLRELEQAARLCRTALAVQRDGLNEFSI